MNKKIIVAIILVILIVVVVFVVDLPAIKKSTSPESTPIRVSRDSQVEATATVEITSAGFNPATISVNEGTVVNFINNDSRDHWIASDPHPAHTNLLGFDSQAPVETGQSYSFLFEGGGKYSYHDHLNPTGLHGTVIVNP